MKATVDRVSVAHEVELIITVMPVLNRRGLVYVRLRESFAAILKHSTMLFAAAPVPLPGPATVEALD
jgi:hypothetical protein